MKQRTMQCFESECGRARIFVDHDMPIGAFHDFLFQVKSKMIEIMKDAENADQKSNDENKE